MSDITEAISAAPFTLDDVNEFAGLLLNLQEIGTPFDDPHYNSVLVEALRTVKDIPGVKEGRKNLAELIISVYDSADEEQRSGLTLNGLGGVILLLAAALAEEEQAEAEAAEKPSAE